MSVSSKPRGFAGLWRGSIRTQLIVTNILVLALLLTAFGLIVSYTVRTTMMNSVDHELDARLLRRGGRRQGGPGQRRDGPPNGSPSGSPNNGRDPGHDDEGGRGRDGQAGHRPQNDGDRKSVV